MNNTLSQTRAILAVLQRGDTIAGAKTFNLAGVMYFNYDQRSRIVGTFDPPRSGTLDRPHGLAKMFLSLSKIC